MAQWLIRGKGKNPVKGGCSLQATCVSEIPVRVSSERTKLSFTLWGGGLSQGSADDGGCGAGDEGDGDGGDCGEGDCDDDSM